MRSISTKFLLAVGSSVVAVVVMIVLATAAEHRRQERAVVDEQLALAMEFGVAVRSYIGEHVRPAMQAHVGPDQFDPETMSTSFVARNVFEKVRERFPQHIIKFSSPNPRNPANLAGPDELAILKRFEDDPELKDWSGFVTLGGREYQGHFRVQRFTQSCLQCHGSPPDAPKSLLSRYGSRNGFGSKVGDIAGMNMVATPIDGGQAWVLARTLRTSAWTIVGLALLLAIIFVLFRRLVGSRLAAMAGFFDDHTHDLLFGNTDRLPETGRDEISVVARSFNTLLDRLRGVYQTMEARVAERTAALTKLNVDLQDEVAERLSVEEALRRERDFAESLIETAPTIVLLLDPKGKIIRFNEYTERLTGYRLDELRGRSWCDVLVPAEDRQAIVEVFQQSLCDGLLQSYVNPIVSKTGSVCRVEWNAKVLRDKSGQTIGLLAVGQDITAHSRTEEALRDKERKYRGIVDNAGIGISLLSPDLRIVSMNQQMRRWFPHVDAETSPKCYTCFNDANHDTPCDHCPVVRTLADGQVHETTTAAMMADEPRHYRIVSSPVTDDEGNITGVIEMVDDITDRIQLEERLQFDACHDALTGLPNRATFMRLLKNACLRAQREDDYEYAVLFLDFDRFKLINDSMGHHVGDQLLKTIAARLKHATLDTPAIARECESHVARLGGDEFTVLVSGKGAVKYSQKLARSLKSVLSAQYELGVHRVYSTASIGIVTSQTGLDEPENVLRDADTAMYRAKSEGRDCYVMFDRAMHEEVIESVQLETDLRHALERDEMRLFLQPIHCLEKSTICGVEALIRWQHGEHGMIAPDRFIPLAEETGLIIPIGEWVIRTACQHVKRLRAALPDGVAPYVCVNVSKRQLMEHGFARRLSEILDEYELEANSLKVEVTESVIMENASVITQTLERIKALGVELLMDDFGTGQSSLSRLHEFPVDAVKIDRAFVASMSENRQFAAIVHAIISLAENLHLKVIAEGVETEDQLAQLIALDCNMAQGYYFARPMPVDELEKHLLDGGYCVRSPEDTAVV